MPVPQRLAAAEAFPDTVTLSPPAPDDDASVPAARAWDDALVQKRSDTHYDIVLARMSAQVPATMGVGLASTPLYQGVLVWVVITHGIPTANSGGGAPPPGVVTVPPRRCYRADTLDLTDAATGQHLWFSSFGNAG